MFKLVGGGSPRPSRFVIKVVTVLWKYWLVTPSNQVGARGRFTVMPLTKCLRISEATSWPGLSPPNLVSKKGVNGGSLA